MKNIAIAKDRLPQTVTQQEVIEAMKQGTEYTQEEVCELLPDRPRSAVRDTLHTLVQRGIVWRATSRSPIKFMLLEGGRLEDAIERATTRGATPEWMKRDLKGYDSANRTFRDLCMLVRK